MKIPRRTFDTSMSRDLKTSFSNGGGEHALFDTKKKKLRSQIFLIRVVFKSSGRYRVSTENLFKIPQKSPLAELVGKHVGVVIPQDTKKSSRVCAKCALKIRNVSALCKFRARKSRPLSKLRILSIKVTQLWHRLSHICCF